VKLRTGLFVVVAGLSLVGVFGCGEDPNKAVTGPVNVPADAPKTSQDAADAMRKSQQQMYGGAKPGSPAQSGTPGPGK